MKKKHGHSVSLKEPLFARGTLLDQEGLLSVWEAPDRPEGPFGRPRGPLLTGVFFSPEEVLYRHEGPLPVSGAFSRPGRDPPLFLLGAPAGLWGPRSAWESPLFIWGALCLSLGFRLLVWPYVGLRDLRSDPLSFWGSDPLSIWGPLSVWGGPEMTWALGP